ncbi:hypothetical protein VTK56DRAFT_5236 [Thermocarpiscus australiensis]
MGKLPSTILRRPSVAAGLPSSNLPSSTSAAARGPTLAQPGRHAAPRQAQHHQVRHATFVPRPRRPYMFTQLVQLSDGSTFTVRTTSPTALYKSAKDSRNHILWQPTEKSLRNVEVDEAGKLAAFRERYGNAWDLDRPDSAAKEEPPQQQQQQEAEKQKATGEDKGGKPDNERASAQEKPQAQAQAPAAEPVKEEDPFDSLVDLISAYATEDKNIKGGLSAKDQARKDKSKKK